MNTTQATNSENMQNANIMGEQEQNQVMFSNFPTSNEYNLLVTNYLVSN